MNLELPECFSAALRPPNAPVKALGDLIKGKDVMVSGSARETSLLGEGQERKSVIAELISPTPNDALPEMIEKVDVPVMLGLLSIALPDLAQPHNEPGLHQLCEMSSGCDDLPQRKHPIDDD